MKYGLLIHEPTTNLGDDIQSYAIKQFLPHVDYYVNREEIDSFKSENNEPVATVMAAWWMWKKFDWPPAECIIPKMVSMHINHYGARENASPVSTEWLEGIGKEYFDAYGPVGVRDSVTLDYLKDAGIDAYFSGCITLTLPKQKETADKGTYVVIADLRDDLKAKVKEWLKDSGLEIREVSHRYSYRKNPDTMDNRFEKIEDLLTLYQNAKFVVTRRLHVTLPCLAMEVPVMSIVDLEQKGNYTRWAPYSDWVNYISEADILAGNINYDYNNPPENKKDYLETRNALTKNIKSFIDEMESYGENVTLEDVKKTKYTETEARAWQYDLLRDTCDKWLYAGRKLLEDYKKSKKKATELEKELEKTKKDLEKTKKDLEKATKNAEKYKRLSERSLIRIFASRLKRFLKRVLKK